MAKDAAGDGKQEQGFEQALERLEEIVERMEQGDLALEEAMSLFEEGVRLGQSCQKRLDEAERKITVLIEKADGSLEEQSFDADAASKTEPPPLPKPPAPRRAAAPRAPVAATPRAPVAPITQPAPARQPSFGQGSDSDDIPF